MATSNLTLHSMSDPLVEEIRVFFHRGLAILQERGQVAAEHEETLAGDPHTAVSSDQATLSERNGKAN